MWNPSFLTFAAVTVSNFVWLGNGNGILIALRFIKLVHYGGPICMGPKQVTNAQNIAIDWRLWHYRIAHDSEKEGYVAETQLDRVSTKRQLSLWDSVDKWPKNFRHPIRLSGTTNLLLIRWRGSGFERTHPNYGELSPQPACLPRTQLSRPKSFSGLPPKARLFIYFVFKYC